MEASFWLEKWASAQIGFHLNTVHSLLQQHWDTLELDPLAPVLVPLCGKSLDLLFIRAKGHPVVGVELSPIAIAQFFEERGRVPQPSQLGDIAVYDDEGLHLMQADFLALQPAQLPAIGAVYDRAALIAMPPGQQTLYAHQLMALAPGAPILLITLDYDQAVMAGPPFATPSEQVQRLFGLHYRLHRLGHDDVLSQNPALAKRGLAALHETAWLLMPQR
jgi:thiopurine S-methyltransferase